MSRRGEDPPRRVDLSYPLAQLDRALQAPDGAPGRVSAWRSVIAGVVGQRLHIGSRTPIARTPAWVTPDVVHGGYATGRLAAGGPLMPHEVSLLRAIGHPEIADDTTGARRLLNAYHLSEEGQEALRAMLATGRFRIAAPEEGALMTVAWLRDAGSPEAADDLLAVIAPWCDRLRFFPAPADDAIPADDAVCLESASSVASRLRRRRPSAQVEAMREAVTVWAPMYDRVVALILESVEGGRPFARTTPEWRTRARGLLDDYADVRARHRHCGKPDRPKENFFRLRSHLTRALETPSGPGAEGVAQTAAILEAYVARHGMPGAPGHAERRERQHRHASLPSHAAVARLVADRMVARDTGRGIRDMETCVAPVAPEEAAELAVPPGLPVPPRVRRVAMRALEAPIGDLADGGVLTSAEAVADLLPAMMAGLHGAGITDPALSRLHDAVYGAFRNRRSLLLLDLQAQVRFRELPWIAALGPWTPLGDAERSGARAVLAQAAELVLTRFPDTITPNPLVREFAAVDEVAGLGLGLTYELAADIFMGEFSSSYRRAAEFACDAMRGTLYARYYALPASAPRALESACRRRAGVRPGSSVAGNGMIIEQAQILTTHNLAQLTHGLGLLPALSSRAPALAEACLTRSLRRLRRPPPWRGAALHTHKNVAYAWRQMLFFLSLAPPDAVPPFLARADVLLDAQPSGIGERFQPALTGLRAVAAGGDFDDRGRTEGGGRRLLGWESSDPWTTGFHEGR